MSEPGASAERWRLIESLFERATELSGSERSAFLQRECADTDMRREVESLLEADSKLDDLLDAPLDAGVRRALSMTLSRPSEADAFGALPPGTLIGAYRVVRELGHGGMGAVYLAERADGAYAQQVALKVVRGGLIAAELERRFLRERQILARLQHANIARLLDGGFTAERLPYLAMEFVDGAPITQWAANRDLDVDQRLRLFLQVCEAVQYAHGQLVVHRDLKPANILVTGDGRVRLLDFGIARLLDDTGDAEALTRTGFLLLTPEYAAPEQIRGEPATAATDVYALGAVLYELLSGKKAFTFGSHSLAEILRVLQEDIAPLAHRQDLPKALRRRLSGDLETIVHRALAREPQRRYPSVEAFAADLRRHLEHRPVEARPDSFGYRLAKYVRRNRVGVSAAVAIVVVIAAGLIATIWQAREAQRQAFRAQSMSDLIYGAFGAVDPLTAQGRTVSAREILDAAAKRVDAIKDPTVRIDVLRTIGDIYFKLALYEPAADLLQRANREAAALYGERSPERGRVLNVQAKMMIDLSKYDEAAALAEEARSIGAALSAQNDILHDALWTLANVEEFKTDYPKAEALFRTTLKLDTQLYGARSAQVGHDLSHIGYDLLWQEKFEEAESSLKQAIEIQTAAVGRESEDVAISLGVLALLYRKTSRLPEAERSQREELEIRIKLFGPDHPRVALSQDQLAGHILLQGRVEEAEVLLEKSLATSQRVLGDQHPELAGTLNSLAMARYMRGNLEGAIEYQRRTVAIDRAVLGMRNRDTANAISNLGRYERDFGDYSAAERSLNEALALRTELVGPEHSETATTRLHLATLHRMQGKLELAQKEYAQVLAVLTKNLPETHPRIAEARTGMGAILVQQGKATEALPMLEQAVKVLRESVKGDDIRTADAELWLGITLTRLSRRAEAEPHLAASHAMLLKLRGADHEWTLLSAKELAKVARTI